MKYCALVGTPYIFELSRIVNSKWAICGLCHYCMQWVLCPREKSATDASGPPTGVMNKYFTLLLCKMRSDLIISLPDWIVVVVRI